MRFKCINDYPGNFHKIGDTIDCVEDSAFSHIAIKYSNLFRLMNWWEEKELMDMPEHVKLTHNGLKDMEEGQFFWVKCKGEFEKEPKKQLAHPICIFFCYLYGNDKRFNYNHFEPATETEYEKYLESLEMKDK